MARLPTPGGDRGNWGSILNDYLSQVHKSDGTIKDNAVASNNIAPNAITSAKIATDAIGAAQIANDSITEPLLASEVRTKLNQVAPTWTTLTGKPAVVAAGTDAAAARTAIGAVDSTTVAAEITNPESVVNNAVVEVATGVQSAGVEGLIKTFDARGNLAATRPTWSGRVAWLIDEGDSTPTHIANGDLIWEVATTPIPWSPAQLPNKIAWYDAQQLEATDGASVALWPDLSGNGNHMTQSTASAQPVIESDRISGHPAVVADGTNDYLRASLTASFPAPFTVYLVAGTALVDNVSSADYLIDAANPGSGNPSNRGSLYRGTDESYWVVRNAAGISSAAGAWTVGTKLLKMVIRNTGQNCTLEVDGIELVSAEHTASTLINELSMFARNTPATNFFNGYMGEAIWVQGEVSSEHDELLKEYLNTRWSLGLIL